MMTTQSGDGVFFCAMLNQVLSTHISARILTAHPGWTIFHVAMTSAVVLFFSSTFTFRLLLHVFEYIYQYIVLLVRESTPPFRCLGS